MFVLVWSGASELDTGVLPAGAVAAGRAGADDKAELAEFVVVELQAAAQTAIAAVADAAASFGDTNFNVTPNLEAIAHLVQKATFSV
jgi:hypothetical protein